MSHLTDLTESIALLSSFVLPEAATTYASAATLSATINTAGSATQSQLAQLDAYLDALVGKVIVAGEQRLGIARAAVEVLRAGSTVGGQALPPLPKSSWWVGQQFAGGATGLDAANQMPYVNGAAPDHWDAVQIFAPSDDNTTGVSIGFKAPAAFDATTKYRSKDSAGAFIAAAVATMGGDARDPRKTNGGAATKDLTNATKGSFSNERVQGWVGTDVMSGPGWSSVDRTDGVTNRGPLYQAMTHCAGESPGAVNDANLNDGAASPFKILHPDHFHGYAAGNQMANSGTWGGVHGSNWGGSGILVCFATRTAPGVTMLDEGDSLDGAYKPGEANPEANMHSMGLRAIEMVRATGRIAGYINDTTVGCRSFVFHQRSDWKIKRRLCTHAKLKPLTVNDIGLTNDSPPQAARTLAELKSDMNRCVISIDECMRAGIVPILTKEPMLAYHPTAGQLFIDFWNAMASHGLKILDLQQLYNGGTLKPEYRVGAPGDVTHRNVAADIIGAKLLYDLLVA